MYETGNQKDRNQKCFVLWGSCSQRRRNCLFSKTANIAKASAILYAIAVTAQANGLNTEQYLTERFSQPAIQYLILEQTHL